jgi:Flp pilus assembly protein TadG
MQTERDRNRTRRPAVTCRARRCRGDGGAIIAEAALLTPFFITLMFGMLEFGGAFRDYLTVSSSTSAAARQAAVQGNAPYADWYILHTIVTASAAMPLSQINYVVIYKANATGTSPPAGCLTSGSTGSGAPSYNSACNRYTNADLLTAVGTAPPTSWTTSGPYAPSQNWPSTQRYVLLASPGPDYVGVYINATHPWITGLFGSTITMTNNTVAQIEPQKLSS